MASLLIVPILPDEKVLTANVYSEALEHSRNGKLQCRPMFHMTHNSRNIFWLPTLVIIDWIDLAKIELNSGTEHWRAEIFIYAAKSASYLSIQMETHSKKFAQKDVVAPSLSFSNDSFQKRNQS